MSATFGAKVGSLYQAIKAFFVDEEALTLTQSRATPVARKLCEWLPFNQARLLGGLFQSRGVFFSEMHTGTRKNWARYFGVDTNGHVVAFTTLQDEDNMCLATYIFGGDAGVKTSMVARPIYMPGQDEISACNTSDELAQLLSIQPEPGVRFEFLIDVINGDVFSIGYNAVEKLTNLVTE